MADNRPQPKKRSTPAPARDMAEQQRIARPSRPEPAAVVSLIEEAERIMGVEPILGRTSRPLPGY